MSDEAYREIGLEYQKEAQRVFPKLLLFAVLTLLSHVIEITPSDIDVGGIKLAVNDGVVIRGGLALLFFFYLQVMVSLIYEGGLMLPLQSQKRMFRSLVRRAGRAYISETTKKRVVRTPRQIKRHVWWSLFSYQLFQIPFWLVFAAIIIGAAVVGAIDLWGFGEFIIIRLVELSG